MIQFYITETGTYNPKQLVDPSQAFVIDIAHKRLKLMENEEYVLEFQKLSDTYATTIDSSNVTGVSQKGINAMYKDLQSQIQSAGVTPEGVSQQINSSLIPVNASIETINSSIDTIETKLGTIAEGAEVNVNPDWTATSGDASILNRPTLGQLAFKDALDASDVGAIPTASVGANNGIAQLDGTGKVPSSQLPSYVDDVLEYDSSTAFPETGASGIIYISLDDNLTYRWGGNASGYVEISKSLAIGETASTAFAGDRGKKLEDDFAAHDTSAAIHVSAADRTDWDAAATASHTHTNKDILDGIADSSFHTHSNKDILDGITDTSISNWNDAETKAHEHSNKSVLDGITADDITNFTNASNNAHEHDNKSVLDGISSDDVTNWNNASNNSHTHTNADILNGITDASITAWNAGEANVNADWNATEGDASILNLPTLGDAASKGIVDIISASTGALVTDGAVKNYVDDTISKAHEHSNKALLDGIADASFHTHDNKNILDDITSADIANWNDASDNSHTHSNKDILDGLTDTSISNWDTAYTNNHTHSNADILNGLTDASIADFIRDTSYGHGDVNELIAGTDTTPKVWDASVINAYLAALDANAVRYKGDINAGTGEIVDTQDTLTSISNKKGDVYVVSTAGTLCGVEMQVGDSIIFKKNVAKNTAPVATDLTFVQGTVKVTNEDATLQWGSLVKIANVEGVDISVALPSNPTAGYGNVVTKDFVDIIDASIGALVTDGAVKNYVDDTISKAHTHANKDLLDSIVDASFHTHSNKDILDGFTDTSISNWNDAYSWGNHALADYASNTRVADLSSYVIDVSTDANERIANVSAYVIDLSTNANSRIANVSAYAVDLSTRVDSNYTGLSGRIAEVSTYASNVSTYAASVSTNTNARIANVSTYAQNVSTYASNVSTYAANTSTRLATTNTNVANVSTYVQNVSTYAANTSTRLQATNSSVSSLDASMRQIFTELLSDELLTATVWNKFKANNPTLNWSGMPVQ